MSLTSRSLLRLLCSSTLRTPTSHLRRTPSQNPSKTLRSLSTKPPNPSTTTTPPTTPPKPTTPPPPKSNTHYYKRLLQITTATAITSYVLTTYYRDPTLFKTRLTNFTNQIKSLITYLEKPSRKKLLPDQEEARLGLPPRKTLLLEIQNVLGRTEYSRQYGWRFHKRPGASALIAHLESKYEMVLFTSENMFDIEWAIEQLEGEAAGLFFRYRLFRAETEYVDGRFVKDLRYLNRRLEDVVVVDWDEDKVKFQKDNLIQVGKWLGDKDDRELLDLIVLLEVMSSEEVGDVREVVRDVRSLGVEKAKENLTERLEKARERGGLLGVFGGQHVGAGGGLQQDAGNQAGATALGRLIGLRGGK